MESAQQASLRRKTASDHRPAEELRSLRVRKGDTVDQAYERHKARVVAMRDRYHSDPEYRERVKAAARARAARLRPFLQAAYRLRDAQPGPECPAGTPSATAFG